MRFDSSASASWGVRCTATFFRRVPIPHMLIGSVFEGAEGSCETARLPRPGEAAGRPTSSSPCWTPDAVQEAALRHCQHPFHVEAECPLGQLQARSTPRSSGRSRKAGTRPPLSSTPRFRLQKTPAERGNFFLVGGEAGGLAEIRPLLEVIRKNGRVGPTAQDHDEDRGGASCSARRSVPFSEAVAFSEDRCRPCAARRSSTPFFEPPPPPSSSEALESRAAPLTDSTAIDAQGLRPGPAKAAQRRSTSRGRRSEKACALPLEAQDVDSSALLPAVPGGEGRPAMRTSAARFSPLAGFAEQVRGLVKLASTGASAFPSLAFRPTTTIPFLSSSTDSTPAREGIPCRIRPTRLA